MEVTGIFRLNPPLSKASQRVEETFVFKKPPRLIKVSTTLDGVWAWGATYYFTLTLPENAGNPLQKVIISQRRGEENIRFQNDKIFAFEGTPSDKGKILALATSTENDETAPITVTFTPPVPPGITLTVGLQPKRNPRFGGTYLFGVTVFPVGEKSRGLYLGVGRLFFYEEREIRFF